MGWLPSRGHRGHHVAVIAVTAGLTMAGLYWWGVFPGGSALDLRSMLVGQAAYPTQLQGLQQALPTTSDWDPLGSLDWLFHHSSTADGYAREIPDDQDFCPQHNTTRRPTIILVPFDDGVKGPALDDPVYRTSFFDRLVPIRTSPVPVNPTRGGPGLFERGVPFDGPSRFPPKVPAGEPCPVHHVPSSTTVPTLPPVQQWAAEERAWRKAGHPEMMFGFATSKRRLIQTKVRPSLTFAFAGPSRALFHFPRWADWLPSADWPSGDRPTHKPAPHRSWARHSAKDRTTAAVLVVTGREEEEEQAWELAAMSKGIGLDMTIRESNASTPEVCMRFSACCQSLTAAFRWAATAFRPFGGALEPGARARSDRSGTCAVVRHRVRPALFLLRDSRPD